MVKIDKAIQVPCKVATNFFYVWLSFFTPIHKMTPGVLKLAAELLKQHYKLSLVISDNSILYKYLTTNVEVREEVLQNCNISLSNYHVGLSKLKQCGFLTADGINPKYIPPIREGKNNINVLFMFNIEDLDDEANKHLQESS